MYSNCGCNLNGFSIILMEKISKKDMHDIQQMELTANELLRIQVAIKNIDNALSNLKSSTPVSYSALSEYAEDMAFMCNALAQCGLKFTSLITEVIDHEDESKGVSYTLN